MKVEVTLQFDIPDIYKTEDILQILRERINNFDYYNEFVQYTPITKPEKSILNKIKRLEHLEQAVSAFNELLEPNSSDRSIEAEQLLAQHDLFFREQRLLMQTAKDLLTKAQK